MERYLEQGLSWGAVVHGKGRTTFTCNRQKLGLPISSSRAPLPAQLLDPWEMPPFHLCLGHTYLHIRTRLSCTIFFVGAEGAFLIKELCSWEVTRLEPGL